jgi:Bacterial SH3 domain
MAARQVLIGRMARLALGLLTSGLCAGLYGCSEAGIVTTQVKLQQAAADESQVLATIPKGSAVNVSGCTNGWCHASWNGREGYVLAKYVRIGNARSRPPADQPVGDGTEDDTAPGPESSEGLSPSD